MRLQRKLVGRRILTEEEAYPIRGMMARGEYAQVRALIDQGIKRKREQQ